MMSMGFMILLMSNTGYAQAPGSQILEQLQRLRATSGPPNNSQRSALTEKPPAAGKTAEQRRADLEKLQQKQQEFLQSGRVNTRKELEAMARETVPAATGHPIAEMAFRDTLKELFPLTPEQIKRIRRKHDRTAFAASQPSSVPPRPTATSQLVNLAPGSTPPVIRLSQGFVSSLVFLDSSGADWPIEAYDVGNPTAFDIQWDKKSSTLMVQAKELYTYGNLAVKLRDLTTPVMLTLVPGQRAVDYRVDLRIQGYGPNAKLLPTTSGLPASPDTLLLSILDGVPPPNSKELMVSGGNAQAWVEAKRMYVRTRLTLISPGWVATMSSADGMHVYEMQKAPRILVSDHGKIIRLKLKGL